MFTLNSPVKDLPQVGPAYVKKLQKVGIKTAWDMLTYYPFRYDDYSEVKKISEINLGEVVSIHGKILDIQNIRTWKRKMFITEALIEDDSGAIKAVWFNQPFLTRNLKKDASVSLSGKIVYSQEGLQISNPAYELLGKQSLHTARLVPVYHETEGLSSRWLRVHIKPLVKLTFDIKEYLPYDIIKRKRLFGIAEAVRQIHFPDNPQKAQKAKKRLAFDELFMIQICMLLQRRKWQESGAVSMKFDENSEKEIKNFVDNLPFKLTNAQRTSSWSIIKDLEKNKPMNRLLEGDVGSGKTLVALIAALFVIRSGYQVAFMAPTEILAGQHFAEAVKRFGSHCSYYSIISGRKKTEYNQRGKNGVINLSEEGTEGCREACDIRIALLTASESRICKGGKEKQISRKEILGNIKKGEIDIVIGTHSLIQERVIFHNLALSIVDEQHRFGIEQRAKLQKEILTMKDGLKTVPHLLSMTATPIPRTLALTVYGDLDLSILDEMPSGRRKIITKLVAPANRDLAYKFIREQIEKGRQVFVICPLIEESDVLEVRSATEEYEKLKNEVYPDLKIGLLHGKMKSKEKESVMKGFSSGEINVLVSTSVVEVGIDVPNATVMLIEGADRFGLAQLHQFRGRVGRGKHQSFCFLFTDSAASSAHRRLKALIKCSNGFELAEKDLEIRGPGELVGIRQSGLPDLAMVSLSDTELIKAAREEAKNLLSTNTDLSKYPELAEKLGKMKKEIHFE